MRNAPEGVREVGVYDVRVGSSLSRMWGFPCWCAFLVYMLPPLPRCSGWAYSTLISPSHVSLPRKGHRVGLHIVLLRLARRSLALRPAHSRGHRIS